jgi:hypothetical protein
MQISIGLDESNPAHFRTDDVKSIEHLAEVVTKTHYSLSTFKDGYRNKANFIETRAIGLDFDAGMTIAEAEEAFKDYAHIIAPSKSHGIEKNGVVADRFRVILFLKEPITDAATFEATWFSLYEKWPAMDKACKDASRFFFGSRYVHRLKNTGIQIEPVTPKAIVKPPPRLEIIKPGTRGKLSLETHKFLTQGTLAEGFGRNQTVFKVTKDFQQNLYTLEETMSQIFNALNEHDIIASDFLESEADAAIRSAFNTEAKHEARIKKNAFRLRGLKEMYQDKTEIDWVVQGLLMVGGLSIISADPKAGKSTVARQLVRDVLRGDKFFGRDCRKGSVFYFGMEEHTQVLNKSFNRLGITEDEPLMCHVGDVLSDNAFDDFRELLIELKPVLVVVDTLMDLIQVENENNYGEMKTKLRKLRQVARDSGTHILVVHHSNKSGGEHDKRRGNQRILGSQAISGGMDGIIVIEISNNSRMITTSGREVDQWNRRALVWDKNTCTYSLGKEEEY